MRRRQFLVSAALGAAGASVARAQPAMTSRDRWQNDGAGTIARFGLLTPDFDPAPESEMCAMIPRGISIHTSRVARSGGPGAPFVSAPHIDEAVDRLVELAPHGILLGYTSSSYALGADADDKVRARLEERAKGIPFIFTCAAALMALRQLHVQRISIVHPPWWSDTANSEGKAYWQSAGFDVLECVRIEPLRSITEVAPAEVFDFVSAHTPRASQAVFIGGNGLRAVGAIRALEARLRRPVLSANQVVVWAALRTVRQAGMVTNYGSIFEN